MIKCNKYIFIDLCNIADNKEVIPVSRTVEGMLFLAAGIIDSKCGCTNSNCLAKNTLKYVKCLSCKNNYFR